MKLKKKILILIVIILLMTLGIYTYILFTIKSVHSQMIEDQIDRLPEVFVSFDERYCMRVVISENIQDSVHYANVIIYDNATEEEIFSIRDEYRAFDFHWAAWEKASDNFWLKSGDLGTFYYENTGNNVWERYQLIKEKDEYFLIKGYGKTQEKKTIKLEDLKERLPKECDIFSTFKFTETEKDNREELQETMPEIIDVVVDDFKVTALCIDGSVWSWDKKQSEVSACKISNLYNITKIVYAGPAMYALSEDGHVYAWGSNKWLQIRRDEEADRNFENAEQILGLNNIVDLDVSADYDSSKARAFAIDESGNFYAWGLYLYWEEDKDYEPGFPEKNADLVQGTDKLFAGAGNYHYFIKEDGTVFSIMDQSIWRMNHIEDFIFPKLPVELDDLTTERPPLYFTDIFYIDLREGTKYGTTILYELGQDKSIECMDADKYTVFMTKEDGTLWYWNSKMIKYHDYKDALADVESGREDYSGCWEKVNIKEVLNITDENTVSPRVVAMCAGSENVLFLTNDGQVFMSKYVTGAIEDVEYYNQENTNPNREKIKKVQDLPLKTMSFQKWDWENIISINSNGLYCFSAVDEAGMYYYVEVEE